MNDKKKNNSNLIIVGAVGLLVIVLVIILLINGCSKGNKDDNSNNEGKEDTTEKVGATEDVIIKSYGMSKQDAINLVKEQYNSENFEFNCEINKDSKYEVIVKNTITDKEERYLVDPTSSEKSFYLITE